jgi:hypothetical protein
MHQQQLHWLLLNMLPNRKKTASLIDMNDAFKNTAGGKKVTFKEKFLYKYSALSHISDDIEMEKWNGSLYRL